MLQDISEIAKKVYVHFDPPAGVPDEKKPGERWVAVLIDGDGLCLNVDKALEEVDRLGETVIRRIYGNYHINAKFTVWKRLYNKYRFERRIVLGVHKNIADMAIVADAVELAITIPQIDAFVIVTHDGGFFPLMHKLVSLEKTVYWIGGEKPYKKADILREEVDRKLAGYDPDKLA